MTRRFVCCMAISTALAFSANAQGQSASVVVSARANIYGAGHAATDDPTGTGGGEVPPILALTQASPSLLVISDITGYVTTDGGQSWHESYNAYNGSSQSIAPWRGLSGLLPTMLMGSLSGVFLDADEPSGEAPPSLSFDYWAAVPDIFPQLRQVFIVTDALGVRIRVPAGATRLALGFVDSAAGSGLPGSYADNEGAFQVLLDIGPLTAVRPSTWGAVKNLYRD